jgi:hypothetical protein
MNTKLENQIRIKADDVLPRTIATTGYDLVGNEYVTDIEVKRAALHPSASLNDHVVRKVRAAAIGLSLYDYEQTLLDMGMDFD